MKRIDITLSDELAEFLEKKSNKSVYVAEALIDRIRRDTGEDIRRKLAEAYKREREEDNAVNGQWESATLENWK